MNSQSHLFKFRKLPPGEPFTPFEAKYLVDCPQCGTTWSMGRKGHRCLWIQPFSDSMYEFGIALIFAAAYNTGYDDGFGAKLLK
jgi:hypothetical protein